MRGPQVMSGYWNKPEETAEVFVDGWFRTGDIVTIDDEGFVTIVDRIKELVITGGFNVSPSEVEDALREFAGVADVAVVGLPSERNGEEVVAAVVLAAGPDRRRRGARAFGKRDAQRLQGAAPGVLRRRAAQVAHRQGAAQEGARTSCSRTVRRRRSAPRSPSWRHALEGSMHRLRPAARP